MPLKVALLVPLLALLLTACAASEPVVVIPDSLRYCAEEPVIPGLVDDKSVAHLLLDYREAWADCKSKHGAVVGLAVKPT
ncbi:hypothetical protein [Inquilinus limosus]|uniref:hypothetical protein n=1 Tax=Inquilinus limosus TaxID=171674 RepID=UPI000479C7D3|nr:hypothetical protein [Inquilinus limosus]